MLSDPSGILSRIPELEPLAEDPGIRRSIERGDVHGIYRALYWANLLGKVRRHRDVIRLLLARRRLFLAPIRSAPTLFTYNGIGASGYGRDDPDTSDGTYILTHFIVFFFVPIFPLRQYLVRDAQASRGRAWTFIGKVPFGPVTFAWNRSIAVAVLATVLAAVASAWQSSRNHQVYIVNETGIPARVEIGGRLLEVRPGGRDTATVHVGRQHVTVASLKGESLESVDMDVRAGNHTSIFNLLGAAPVFVESVTYRPEGALANEHPPDPTVACGARVIDYQGVTDLFVDPPKTIQTSSKSESVTRTHVGVAAGGAGLCVKYLLSKDRTEEAVELARRAAEATGFEDEPTTLAAGMLRQTKGLGESLAFIARALVARPNAIELHRIYQDVGTAGGAREELLAQYQKKHQEQPDSADFGYLHARLEVPLRAAPITEELVRRFPDHMPSRRAHAYNEYQLRRFEQAVESFRVLRKMATKEWLRQLPHLAGALVAIGRGEEALRELESAFDEQGADKPAIAELHARVARVVGSSAEYLFLKLPREVAHDTLVWHRALAGLPVSEDQLAKIEDRPFRDAVDIVLAVRSTPDKALELSARASERTLRILDDEVWALMYAEAVRRTGEEKAVQALASANAMRAELTHAVRAFVEEGRREPALDETSFELRAAIEFARSRRASVNAAERGDLLASARRDDLLHGPVTAAIDGWGR
jgi:hypothetical protein